MFRRGVSHARLMRESEDCIETAARTGDAQEQLVADRILGDTHTWRRWEVEHAELLRNVAEHGRVAMQDSALRAGSFALIHRKALFEYLRDRGLRGELRQKLVTSFRPSVPYMQAMVAEHGQFVRSAGSFLCARHLGVAIFDDRVFEHPLRRYESAYTEYFGLFCDLTLTLERGAREEELSAERALLVDLKQEVNRQRQVILRLPPAVRERRREFRVRQSAVDTLGRRQTDYLPRE